MKTLIWSSLALGSLLLIRAAAEECLLRSMIGLGVPRRLGEHFASPGDGDGAGPTTTIDTTETHTTTTEQEG